MIAYFGIALVLSVALVALSMFLLTRKASKGAGTEKDRYKAQVGQVLKEIKSLLGYKDSYVSKGQFDYIVGVLEKLRTDLGNEQKSLKDIESKLDGAQKSVEEKETAQQEVKSSNAEKEAKLESLMNSFSKVSNESVLLEKRIAESLKYLDSIKGELNLTDKEKGVLDELNNALTNSGANLRDLMMEYDAVSERLQSLQSQYTDLEEEYTRLVEKQLGE